MVIIINTKCGMVSCLFWMSLDMWLYHGSHCWMFYSFICIFNDTSRIIPKYTRIYIEFDALIINDFDLFFTVFSLTLSFVSLPFFLSLCQWFVCISICFNLLYFGVIMNHYLCSIAYNLFVAVEFVLFTFYIF